MAALPLAKLENLNSEEALEGSVLSTTNLLSQFSNEPTKTICKTLCVCLSSMVYGDFQENPATEEHPTNPKEIYGTMKLAGESITGD